MDRKVRIMKERKKANEERIEADLQKWDPQADKNATGNPENTLFVGSLVSILLINI